MGLILKASEKRFEPIPEDTYPAVCVGLYDIGEQFNEKYDKAQKKVVITWELIGATYQDEVGNERNKVVSKTFTASLHKQAKLRQILKSWRGKEFTPEELEGFDLKNILGAPCLVQIIHAERDGLMYANVGSVTKLPKSFGAIEHQNEPICFDIADIEEEKLNSLPEWIREKVKQSSEYQNANIKEVEGEEAQLPF